MATTDSVKWAISSQNENCGVSLVFITKQLDAKIGMREHVNHQLHKHFKWQLDEKWIVWAEVYEISMTY